MKVLIYSNKHNAWWKDDYCGYGKIEDAGIYELDDVLSDRCYSDFDFDKGKDNYFVKLEDAMGEFMNRKDELFWQIDIQINSLAEEIKSCFHKQKTIEEKIVSIALELSQNNKEESK